MSSLVVGVVLFSFFPLKLILKTKRKTLSFEINKICECQNRSQTPQYKKIKVRTVRMRPSVISRL